MTTKPILRVVRAPLDVENKCSLCACRGRCVSNDAGGIVVLTPTNCYLPDTYFPYIQTSIYFKEVVREPVRS